MEGSVLLLSFKKVGLAALLIGSLNLLLFAYIVYIDLSGARNDALWLAKDRALALASELERINTALQLTHEVIQPNGPGQLRFVPWAHALISKEISIQAVGLLDQSGGTAIGGGSDSIIGDRAAFEDVPKGTIDLAVEILKSKSSAVLLTDRPNRLVLGYRPEGSGTSSIAVIESNLSRLLLSGSSGQSIILVDSSEKAIDAKSYRDDLSSELSSVRTLIQILKLKGQATFDQVIELPDSDAELAVSPVGIGDIWVGVPISIESNAHGWADQLGLGLVAHAAAVLFLVVVVLLRGSKPSSPNPRSKAGVDQTTSQGLEIDTESTEMNSEESRASGGN